MKDIQKWLRFAPSATILPVLTVIVVSFAVYANALENGFIYDDHSQILKNPLFEI